LQRKSFAFKSQFIRTAAPLSVLQKNINHKGRFLFTPCKIVDLFAPLKNVLGEIGRFDPWANRPQISTTTAYFTAWICSSFDEAMGDFNEKIMLDSH